MSDEQLKKQKVIELQRLSSHYYMCAFKGYDATTGEKDKPSLQRYAARRGMQAHDALIALIEKPA